MKAAYLFQGRPLQVTLTVNPQVAFQAHSPSLQGEDAEEESDDDVVPWLASSRPSRHVMLALVKESPVRNSRACELAVARVKSVSHNDQFMIGRHGTSKRVKTDVPEDDGHDKTR